MLNTLIFLPGLTSLVGRFSYKYSFPDQCTLHTNTHQKTSQIFWFQSFLVLFEAMKIQYSCHSIIVIVVIILISQYHTCSCRYINHNHHPSSSVERSELTEQNRIRTKFLSTFARYFSTVPDHYARRMNQVDDPRLHVVSRRIVPCGPNPLHN